MHVTRRAVPWQTIALLFDPTIHFLSPAMMFLVVTVWCRMNSEETLTWFGVIHFSPKWLPWVLLVISFMLYNNPVINVMGIAAGFGVLLIRPLSLSLSLSLSLLVFAGGRCVLECPSPHAAVGGGVVAVYAACTGSWLMGTPLVIRALFGEQ
jgi:hypothetical protein|eukprot:COSAG01_NODE_3359_length_6191_cov_21.406291_3_plen_152_part_00